MQRHPPYLVRRIVDLVKPPGETGLGWLLPPVYVVLLLLPVVWLVASSFKFNSDMGPSLIPPRPTLHNYRIIFGDPAWYFGYLNSLAYVLMNVVISVSVALPAAYAFSRYRFIGDRQMFFFFLASRMTPQRRPPCVTSKERSFS